jgi:DNA-binding LytR/AlgR family response regulator
MTRLSALIAEDEPLLAQSLRQELQQLWPELHVVASVADGISALQHTLQHLPDVLFLDIRMPGMTGLDVAQALAEDWPVDRALPRIVFVTAYDQYALQAFDAQALDYLLKPVQRERLARTIERLKQPRTTQTNSAQALHASINHIEHALTTSTPQPPRLQAIQANVGAVLHRVALDDVLFFAAADKYVRVVTAQREYLIRTPIKTLRPQLDPAQFWQIHRSTVVQASRIASVSRDAQGKVWLRLKQHSEPLVVSRLHTDLFKAM